MVAEDQAPLSEVVGLTRVVAHQVVVRAAGHQVADQEEEDDKQMKKTLLLILTLTTLLASAQTAQDALQYSLINYYGSARFDAMGGAFNALGGDYSSVLINPAGGSIYKTTGAEFTLGVSSDENGAMYNGSNAQDVNSNIYVGTVGFIKRYEDALRSPNWSDLTFTVGFARLNDFNRNQQIQGEADISRADYFADLAQGTPYENLGFEYPFDAELAWYTFLIDTLGTPDNYVSLVQNPGGLQQERINSSGSQNEINLGLSTCYANSLHFGASIGIPIINYSEERYYDETGLDSASNTVNGWSYNQFLETSGGGFNVKLGIIYRPANWLRLAAAYHSPSWYTMEEFYSSSMRTNFSDGGTITRDSPEGNYTYDLRTPGRWHLGAAVVIAPAGVVSVDYEIVDYSNAEFGSVDGFDYGPTNSQIANSYSNSNVLRIGTEWRVKNLYFRGGYQVWGSPLNNASPFSYDRTSISGGIGFRSHRFQLDLTYMATEVNSTRYLYATVDGQETDPVSITNREQRFVMTAAFPIR